MAIHKITIDTYVNVLVNKYVERMSNKNSGSRTETLLDKLIGNIINGYIVPECFEDNVQPYIESIKEQYKNLLVVHPKDFPQIESVFNAIIPTEEVANVKLVKRKDDNGNDLAHPETLWLHKEITRCLRYDHIQSKVFPFFMRQLGIKTCVYCNAQYAITTKDNQALYQLDHFYPKSRYPYLSSSFFNLQPCCSICNIHKSDSNGIIYGEYNISMWKEKDDDQNDYFKFEIEPSSLASYQINHDIDKIDIKFLPIHPLQSELEELTKEVDKTFKLSDLYHEHNDVVEEVIWKKQIYSQSYIDSLKEAFNEKFEDIASDFPRFISGTYLDKDAIYKRPLAKLVQDIAKQIHLEL